MNKLVLIVLLCACSTTPRTQVMVIVDAESGVRGAASKVRVVVRGGRGDALEERVDQVVGSVAEPVSWPVIAALVPVDDDANRTFEIEAEALDDGDARVGIVRARSGYLSGQTLELRLVLEDCCRSVSCGASETCRGCGCAPANVDPMILPDHNPNVDGGVDAQALDAGLDAAQDASIDGATEDAGDVLQQSCAALAECGIVDVSGATFTMGDDMVGPPFEVSVSGFGIDQYEVTVGRFREFVRAGMPSVAMVPYPSGPPDVLTMGPVLPETTLIACNWTDDPAGFEAHPINCVTYESAQAFCVWDGGRLPTEAEWELAARGRAVDALESGRVYAWGDIDPSPTCDRGQWNECAGDDGRSTRRVGSFAATGDVYDLTGNVSEWTADTFEDYGVGCWASVEMDPRCTTGVRQVLRGGSYASLAVVEIRAASRSGRHGRLGAVPGAGFRCVY